MDEQCPSSYVVMDRHDITSSSTAASESVRHGDNAGSPPPTIATTMRGAAAARKALAFGENISYMPEHYPERRDGDGDGNQTVVDRGSCSRSATTTCPNCNGSKDHGSSRSAACEEVGGAAVVVGKDHPRWDDCAAQDGRGLSRDATTSSAGAAAAAAAGNPQFFSSSQEMKAVKEEERKIESDDVGVHESTLEKLKRKIRLKLLAEETRNSQQVTRADQAQEYVSNGGQENLRAAAGAGPSSSRKLITENPNTDSYRLPEQHHSQAQLQQHSHACKQPLKNNGQQVKVQGRIVVDLSSDDEADVSNPSRFQQQQQQQQQKKKKNCKHLNQRTSQAALGGAASATLLRPKQEEEDYSSILERVLRPLVAAAGAAAAVMDQSTVRPAPKKSYKTSSGGSNKPTSKVKCELVDELADLLDPGRGKNSLPVAASSARRRKKGGSSLDNMLDKNPPKKRGRPKKVSPQQPTTTPVQKELKSAKEKGVPRIPNPLPNVSNVYELERENNVLRNRAFLQGLFFKGPQPQSMAETPLPVLETLEREAWGEEDGDRIRNNDLHSEHRVESQRSQITFAFSGTSAMQRSGKTPITADAYESEEEDLEENDDYSAKSSKLSSMRGKAKPSQNSSKDKAPRGRPRKVKLCATETAFSNQELMKILAELIVTSNNTGSLPPNLLQRLESSSNGGDSSEQTASTMRRGRPPGSKKKPTEVRQQKEKRKAESSTPPPRIQSGSPTSTSRSAESEGKKRKETWLTTIPFETPKTDYELQRDQAVQDRKDHFEKMGAVADLLGEINAPPRPTRPYHKRWTSLNPEYNRQTRLKDRLSAKSDTLAAVKSQPVKEEILEADYVDTLSEVRPDASFADSLVSKFSNWATLQKQRPASPTREWDLNEPSMSMGSRVISFEAREGREQLFDPLLTRIYTMDTGAVKGEYNGLLAAGGSQGRIAVFALKASEAWSSYGRARLDAFSDEDEARVPILAWSTDSSWISQVIFLPSQFKEKEMLLLSSSNDGRVVLWDVNQVRVKKGTRELSQEGMPRVVCQTTTLHSGSIFGMHEMEGRMATASEDGVGISAIRETMIFMERCVSGHHSGVIRSVRFRDKNVLADCGADMEIGILDLRCPEPCTLKLATEHKTTMSMVEWSPGSDNVLLSASFDPQIYLHDIRSTREFTHKLDSHVHPRRLKCYSVYRPTFVDGGQAVVSPGEGTHQLSLYAVDTGSAIGKVDLGFDATIAHWSGLVPSAEGGLWVGSNHAITFCKPVWLPPGSTTQFDNDDPELLQPSSQHSDGGVSVAGDASTPSIEEPL